MECIQLPTSSDLVVFVVVHPAAAVVAFAAAARQALVELAAVVAVSADVVSRVLTVEVTDAEVKGRDLDVPLRSVDAAA